MIPRFLATVVDPSPTLHAAFGWPPLVWTMRIGVMLVLLMAAFVIVRFVSTRVPRPNPSTDHPPGPSLPADRRTADRPTAGDGDADANLKAAAELAEASRQIEVLLARLTRMAVQTHKSTDDRGTRKG